MKFELKAIDLDGFESTRKFETETWFNVLEEFVYFLRGAGYLIPDGCIQAKTFFPEQQQQRLNLMNIELIPAKD